MDFTNPETQGIVAVLVGVCAKMLLDSRKTNERATLVDSNLERVENQMRRLEDQQQASLAAFAEAVKEQSLSMRDLRTQLKLQDQTLTRIGNSLDKIIEKMDHGLIRRA